MTRMWGACFRKVLPPKIFEKICWINCGMHQFVMQRGPPSSSSTWRLYSKMQLLLPWPAAGNGK
jgi:hypothetical protein